MFARLTLIRVMWFFSAVLEIFMQNHEPRKHRSLFFSSIVRFNATHEYLLIFFYSNFSFYFLIRYDNNTLHFKKKFFVYSNAHDHMIELIIDTYYSKYYSINIIKVFFIPY